MVSLGELLPLGNLERRRFQQTLKSLKPPLSRARPSQKYTVSNQMRLSLTWWYNLPEATISVPITHKEASVTLVTDASRSGWGAHCGERELHGLWSEAELNLHINALELVAISKAIQALRETLQFKTVDLRCDNVTAIAYLKKQGGTHSDTLSCLAEEILRFCARSHIVLLPKYIPTDLNVLADRLSRMNTPALSEWKLHTEVFQSLCQKFFHPQVDLFATRWNHQLRKFISPCPDTRASQVDAMQADWSQYEAIYLFPPPKLLGKIIPKLQAFKGRAIVVAPFNKLAPHIVSLNELAKFPPYRIPLRRDLLSQGINSVFFHPEPQKLNLHVWIC